MSLKQQVLTRLRGVARRYTRTTKLVNTLSPHLPSVTCIDVGASYYPHGKWRLFLEAPAVRWIAVEPNEINLAYTKTWQYRSSIDVCTQGLSREGGTQTLYVTNIDSGSSLLEPQIPESMKRRVVNLDYFFPLRKQQVATLTLRELIDRNQIQPPIVIKLDTQGTELAILSGAEDHLRSHSIVGIELEATMLAEPIMQGAGKFWQACEYLEGLGYELLHVKPIYGGSRTGIQRPRGVTFLNECDAVFAVRQNIAKQLPEAHRVTLLTFYLSNRLFEEALLMLADDLSLQRALQERGCRIDALQTAIRALA